jgi:hypothetical protein
MLYMLSLYIYRERERHEAELALEGVREEAQTLVA